MKDSNNIEENNSKNIHFENVGHVIYSERDTNTGNINNTPVKKNSLINRIDSAASITALIAFILVEIGTFFYPISFNHLISGVFAVIVFFIIVAINRS